MDVLDIMDAVADGSCMDSEVALRQARAAVSELIDAVDKLFSADMEYCMMMDGKQDQIDAIEFAKSALKRVKGE